MFAAVRFGATVMPARETQCNGCKAVIDSNRSRGEARQGETRQRLGKCGKLTTSPCWFAMGCRRRHNKERGHLPETTVPLLLSLLSMHIASHSIETSPCDPGVVPWWCLW